MHDVRDTWLTLRGYLVAQKDAVRRARDERAGRYPLRISTRLDAATYTALCMLRSNTLPDLTDSEIVRAILEYALVYCDLRDELQARLQDTLQNS